MPKEIKDYEDIGHDNPRAVLWLLFEGHVDQVISAGQRSHERVFGLIESENNWRGRFDPDTGDCSVLPPLSWSGNMPLQAVLDQLTATFAPRRFHYFSRYGHGEFSPNPGKW